MKNRLISIIMILIMFLGLSTFFNSVNASDNQIIDGTYVIKSAIDEKYVLDVSNASCANGANIQIWRDSNVKQQEFKITDLHNGYYTIMAIHSNKLLDVYYATNAAGTNVQQYQYNGSIAQQWKIKNVGNGYYSFASRINDNLLLDVNYAKANNGTNIQVYTNNGSNAQKFKIEKVMQPTKTIEDGDYIIESNANSSIVFDIDNASKNNGGNLQIYQKNNSVNQVFNVKKLSTNYYVITSKNSGKVLDVSGGGTAPGTNVQQYESNNTNSQQWIIANSGNNNSYNIVSKCNNLCLDIFGGIVKNGTNVQVYTGNGTIAQQFKFIPYNNNTNTNINVGKRTINDGNYVIKSKINTKFSIDVEGSSTLNNANIHLWEYLINQNQMFNVKYLNNGYYSISSIKSNKMLDVQNQSKNPGTNVQQYMSNGCDAQQWIIKDAGDGSSFNVISKCNGLCLDVVNANANNGSNIQVYTPNGSNAQKFYFQPVEVGYKTIDDGIYTFKSNLNTNYVLDIAGGSFSDGANVQMWSDSTVPQQAFRFNYVGEGYYKITSINSSKSLDVAGGSQSAGANLQQYAVNNSSSQQWIVRDLGSGNYNIISKCNNLYVDVKDASAKNGTNIQLYTGDGNNAQKFKIEKSNSNLSIDTSRYPGYKEKVDELKKQHPNWYFEYLYTGVNFNDAVNGEHNRHGANVVPNTYSGEWICSDCGTKLYDTGWYCASRKAVAYYMDPRNFLDSTNVFQYQNVNDYTYGVYSQATIQQQVNGTFLQNYAWDVYTACQNQSVNPYYIIARLIQENGRGGSTTSRGMDGGNGQLYYNPFNIGAHGNGSSEVLENAKRYAINSGWDTMEKSLEGGITFCKSNWLDNYQNTLYQNRFDIDTRNGSALYSHQYMQNLMGAYSEARTLSGCYSNTGKTNSDFVFIIPVYEGMSSSISQKPAEVTGPKIKTHDGDGCYIRSAPGTTNSERVCWRADGTPLTILNNNAISADGYNWIKVKLRNENIEGYIANQYVQM